MTKHRTRPPGELISEIESWLNDKEIARLNVNRAEAESLSEYLRGLRGRGHTSIISPHFLPSYIKARVQRLAVLPAGFRMKEKPVKVYTFTEKKAAELRGQEINRGGKYFARIQDLIDEARLHSLLTGRPVERWGVLVWKPAQWLNRLAVIFTPAELLTALGMLRNVLIDEAAFIDTRNQSAKKGKQSKRDARREKARAMFERIRKKESVNLYAKGPIVKRIARRLRISERTAKDYLAGLK